MGDKDDSHDIRLNTSSLVMTPAALAFLAIFFLSRRNRASQRNWPKDSF